MQKHDIRYFFYVGGNDSSDTLRIVNHQAEEAGYEFRAIHIPKTIDNDLILNDHCPGFGSAARFVTQAFIGLNLDNRALSGVLIGVVMGRHAGFLTASSNLARKYVDEGPHLIYLPERPFSPERFLADVDRVYSQYGLCTVAVSEGICDERGTAIAATLAGSAERDAHGNVQLSGTGVIGDLLAAQVKSKLKIKRVRADTFGYLQRSFLGVVSDRDAHEAREVGEIAVQYAMWDNVDGSVVIRRPVLNYSVSYDLVPLREVAGKTRVMPDEFINAEGRWSHHGVLQLLPAAAWLRRSRTPSTPRTSRSRTAGLTFHLSCFHGKQTARSRQAFAGLPGANAQECRGCESMLLLEHQSHPGVPASPQDPYRHGKLQPFRVLPCRSRRRADPPRGREPARRRANPKHCRPPRPRR